MAYEAGGLKGQIEEELTNYLTGTVNISENYDFSQAKLTRRISQFENKIYPTGKFDSQGNYKFWFDIQTPRVEAEIKNIDFDTKNIEVYSERKKDDLANVIVNLKLKEYLRDNGQSEELNSAIEEGAGWGNVVWKKTKEGYERVDIRNFYVINQTVKCLDETPVIERHQYTQTDLRAKQGIWDHIKETIEGCKNETYSATVETQGKITTIPYYEIYERNGEVCLKDLKEVKGEPIKDGDDDKYVWAKIIVSAVKSGLGINVKYILFAEDLGNKTNKDIYEEYHRGRYKNRWWREGLIELLFDCQVRANQIGNQIAQGLEWASKTIFASDDKLIVQNILSDLANGDIIQARSLRQIEVRMQGLDQLIADWNRNLETANEIANSREVVQGEATPGQPFRLGALLNQNANKLFDFIREKLAIPFSRIFEKWVIPQLIKELKTKEILRLTGNSDMLDRLYDMIVDDWYIKNLLAIGPHDSNMAQGLKDQKLQELKKQPQLLMTGLEGVFEDYKPNVAVIITGENSRLPEDLQTLATFISLEQDPVRRSYLLDLALSKKGFDVGGLPRSTPQQLSPQSKVTNQPISPLTPLAGIMPKGATQQ